MKIYAILLQIILLFLLCLSATAKENAPKWVTDWKSAFSDSAYIAQRGMGKSAELARTEALGAVARYLKSEVRASEEAAELEAFLQ